MAQRIAGRGRTAVRAMRHARYRWYWYSGLGMTAAQGIQQLTIAWLVLDLTGSVGQLGLVIFMQGLPMTLVLLFGGVLADRYDRRSLLIAAQTVTMLNLFALAILTMTGLIEIWHVYLSAIGLGVMQGVTQPARNAMIRSLVDQEDLPNAVGLNAMQTHSSRIVWPSVAGAMITVVGVGATLCLSAAGSLAGILCLRMIGGDRGDEGPVRAQASSWQQMVEGLRYAFREPGISTVVVLVVCCGLFGVHFSSLAPGFAREELGLDASGAGLFMMAMGVGAIVGSTLATIYPATDGKRLFVLVAGAYSLVLVAQAANPWLPAAFLLMALLGSTQTVASIAGQTFLQVTVPQRLLGRVIGLWSMAPGLGAIAALPVGLIGDQVGLRWSIGGSAALLLLLIVWFGAITQRLGRRVAEVTPSST